MNLEISQQRQNEDEKWMQAALEWSWRGKGFTSPRPSVGCVLVRDGQIIGGGHTQRGNGNPHAEVMALRAAWQHDPIRGARGATAYVTLEPCSHWGTTPPCCDSLAREGIVRVVAGVLDPDPRVAGRGFSKMKNAQMEVETGILGDECFAAMDDFLFHIVQKRPFVTLKSAASLDGKIALRSGESKWITGAKSRAYGHQLRHFHDVVLVGIETVLADDPQLSVRLEGHWKQPKRLVLDSQARLPLDAKIWQDAPELLVATLLSAPPENIEKLQQQGATIIQLAPDLWGRVPWEELLRELYARDIASVLIEGGARVAGSALRVKIVNKLAFFIAPVLVGEGKSAIEGVELESIANAPRLEKTRTSHFDNDVLIEGYLAASGE